MFDTAGVGADAGVGAEAVGAGAATEVVSAGADGLGWADPFLLPEFPARPFPFPLLLLPLPDRGPPATVCVTAWGWADAVVTAAAG
jgi:hypothetical protein